MSGSKRILIVDDNADNVFIRKRFLLRAGYEQVESVTDPRAAVGTFERLRPDLVLLDLNMPHMDGCEVLAAIRGSGEEGASVPVVVTSAEDSSSARKRALAAGANEFCSEAIELGDFLAVVARCLSG
jgi:CheY-like chemotaxis protein